MTAWSDLITALATGREDPTLEEVNGRLTDRHVRVVTGTGNASEQRELDALCRGLRSQP